jgi:hypothetical protein
MPFCPNCRTEYRPGFVKCSDCGQPLTDKLPDNPADVTPEDYLVSAFDPPDPLIGQSLAALLEENGIRCILKSEQIPAYADVAMMLRPRQGRKPDKGVSFGSGPRRPGGGRIKKP